MSTTAALALLVGAAAAYVLAGAFRAGESAVLRLGRSAALELAVRHPTQQNRLRRLLADPGATASSASAARVVLETGAATATTLAMLRWVPRPVLVLGIGVLLGIVVAVVLGRVSPRALGSRSPAGTLLVTGALLDVTNRAFAWTSRAARGRANVASDDRSRTSDLRDLIDRAEETGVIREDERDMIQAVLGLSSTVTREVMLPRTDIVSIVAGASLTRALRLFVRSGFSRVPVVGESNDDLRGILYLKDVVRVLDAGASVGDGAESPRSVEEVMRVPVLVPESTPVDALLREFQTAPSHLAMVVDEYGGIAGLVTIEDTIEEIVGELIDEHDVAPPEAEKVADGRWRVPARMGIDELGELFERSVEDDDVDSVGGLVAKALGKVPLPGSVTSVAGLELEAERVEGRRRRLSTVLVRVVPEPAGEQAQGSLAEPVDDDPEETG